VTITVDVKCTLEKTSFRPEPYEIVARRPGDVASRYAEPADAAKLLGWHRPQAVSV
jgi:UDP-glucose 4-epimerase